MIPSLWNLELHVIEACPVWLIECIYLIVGKRRRGQPSHTARIHPDRIQDIEFLYLRRLFGLLKHLHATLTNMLLNCPPKLLIQYWPLIWRTILLNGQTTLYKIQT